MRGSRSGRYSRARPRRATCYCDRCTPARIPSRARDEAVHERDRDLGLEKVVEGVGKEHDFARVRIDSAAAPIDSALAPGEPRTKCPRGKARQLAGGMDLQDAPRDRSKPGRVRECVGQMRCGGAEPCELVDAREEAHVARAAVVLIVLCEKFRFIRRHIDCRRALGLAGFA